MVRLAEDRPEDDYRRLVGLTETALAKQALTDKIAAGTAAGRAKPARVKADIVAERGYRNIQTLDEDVC